MKRTLSTVVGLVAGAAIALAPVTAGAPAFAAETAPTTPVLTVPVDHEVLHAAGTVTKNTVILRVSETLPDGYYYLSFGYMTKPGSVAAMRTFVIRGGQVVAGDGDTHWFDRFTARIALDEMRFYSKDPKEAQGEPAHLKRFPGAMKTQYLMGIVNLGTGAFYEVKLSLWQR